MKEEKRKGKAKKETEQTNTAAMLNFIRQGTQMGRQGILDLLEKTEDPAFRRELKRQLSEYEAIYASADELLAKRGEKQENISPMARVSSQMMSAVKTWRDPSVSHMAEMMVQGNTMGVTETIRKQKEYRSSGNAEAKVEKLTEQFLSAEEENVEEMKRFL